MNNSSIIIKSVNGNFDYETTTDLPIKLNRIVDDQSDPSKRFGEFSFSFNLPKTKNNSKLFGFPDVKGRTRIFIGKQFEIDIIIGTDRIVNGILELNSFDQTDYKCVFYSKFTQLTDAMKGKKLSDITNLPTISWNFEKTIVNHILSGFTNSDQTTHVFPYAFYQTPFMSGATYTQKPETYMSFHYNSYIWSDTQFKGKNPVFYSAMPPALFLMRVFDAMFNEIGWNYGGSFFQRPELKKIVIPFTGKAEDYSAAISGSTGNYNLNLNKLLPTTSMIDFLKSLINMFNLYIFVKPDSKQVIFETFNVLFNRNNPYDITDKIDRKSIQWSEPNSSISISFAEDSDNNLVGGNDRIFDYSNLNRLPVYTLGTANNVRGVVLGLPLLTQKYQTDTFKKLFNKSDGDKDVKLSFAPLNVINYGLINNRIYNSANDTIDEWTNAKYTPFYITSAIPFISVQTPVDNNGKVWAEEKADNYATANDPANQEYEGGVKLAWWYGDSKYNLGITGSSKSNYFDWQFVSVATGGTAQIPKSRDVRLQIMNPFKLLSTSEFGELKGTLEQNSPDFDRSGTEGAEAQYLLSLYYTCGLTGGTYSTTPYSLTLSKGSLFPNLYSTFHENKFLRLDKGSILDGTMIMKPIDWNSLQIGRAIRYDSEVYQLLSIRNYDPINQKANISMLKI